MKNAEMPSGAASGAEPTARSEPTGRSVKTEMLKKISAFQRFSFSAFKNISAFQHFSFSAFGF
jgi:hypothetical protein